MKKKKKNSVEVQSIAMQMLRMLEVLSFLIQLSQTVKEMQKQCKEIWKPKEKQKEQLCACRHSF